MESVSDMTPRIQRYRDLRTIRQLTGQYNRRLSHVGASNFLQSYKFDTTTGYPHETAVDRANDVAYAAMRGL